MNMPNPTPPTAAEQIAERLTDEQLSLQIPALSIPHWASCMVRAERLRSMIGELQWHRAHAATGEAIESDLNWNVGASNIKPPFTPAIEGNNDGIVRDADGTIVADCHGWESRACLISYLLNNLTRASVAHAATGEAEALQAQFRELREVLGELVALKWEKDNCGKSDRYERDKAKAWLRAKSLLESQSPPVEAKSQPLPPRGEPTGGFKNYPDCRGGMSSTCGRPDCLRCDDFRRSTDHRFFGKLLALTEFFRDQKKYPEGFEWVVDHFDPSKNGCAAPETWQQFRESLQKMKPESPPVEAGKMVGSFETWCKHRGLDQPAGVVRETWNAAIESVCGFQPPDGGWALGECEAAIEAHRVATEDKLEKLTTFKTYVHNRLDDAGVETHPNGPHSKEGCRVGDRLDIVSEKLARLAEAVKLAGAAKENRIIFGSKSVRKMEEVYEVMDSMEAVIDCVLSTETPTAPQAAESENAFADAMAQMDAEEATPDLTGAELILNNSHADAIQEAVRVRDEEWRGKVSGFTAEIMKLKDEAAEDRAIYDVNTKSHANFDGRVMAFMHVLSQLAQHFPTPSDAKDEPEWEVPT